MITGEGSRDNDELLKKFWEIENPYLQDPTLSVNERKVMDHVKENHHRDTEGRFIVPLPLNPYATPLGESRARAIRRFKILEQSLYAKAQFKEFASCIQKYFELGHAELVPGTELQKPYQVMYYMPMHVVRKESSTTIKLRVVSDTSCLLYTSPSPRDGLLSRMPSSA